MAINTSIGMVGAALQTDDDTRATSVKYAHGLTGGSPIAIDRSASDVSVACGTRASTDGYVESIEANPTFDTLGYADVIGLYYYAALGNIASAAGDKDGTYKHVITMGDDLPSLTVWGKVGKDNYGVTSGCKMDTLGMSFEGNSPLTFSATAMGRDVEFLDTDPFTGVDPSCFSGYFVPTDCTLKLDTAGSNPADAIITSGSIEISNNCEGFRSCGQVMPSRVNAGKVTVSPSFTVVPDDIKPYRKMITGSETGTKPSGNIVYGSYTCTFRHSVNADWSITFESDRVPFTADFVDVDPDGGSGEFTFTADSAYIASKDASPVTVTVVNGESKYTL